MNKINPMNIAREHLLINVREWTEHLAVAQSIAHLVESKHRKIDFLIYFAINLQEKYKNVGDKGLENADLVLVVADARDTLGTCCSQVERAVRVAPGNKKLVLILNKADLVPKENLNNWLKYFIRPVQYGVYGFNSRSKLEIRAFFYAMLMDAIM
uniref:Uncharacterized protein n=1 Tax=Glossina pallidipes TaxID=7398 RepID=A0A1A9ZV22_GLOPL